MDKQRRRKMKKQYKVIIRNQKEQEFTLTCDRPSEAVEALFSARDEFGIDISKEEVLRRVAEIMNGERTGHHEISWALELEGGEGD